MGDATYTTTPPAAPKSPKAKPTKTKTKTKSNPTMHGMVLEALTAAKGAKGLSLQAIKRFITDTYPDTRENFSNARLRKAMTKGMELNEIIRPKSSEEVGMKGHFLINRNLISQREKDKKQAIKIKEAAKKANQASKTTKKSVKSPAKAKSAPKSPGAGKEKAAKSPARKPSTKAKSPASKAAKTQRKPLKEKQAKADGSPKKSYEKGKKVKKSTPKISKLGTAGGTPKLSKSTTAGSRQKTAVIKKVMKPKGKASKAAE